MISNFKFNYKKKNSFYNSNLTSKTSNSNLTINVFQLIIQLCIRLLNFYTSNLTFRTTNLNIGK